MLTNTGLTARRVSQARPGVPILAMTGNERVANQLALWHGVVPLLDELEDTVDGLIAQVDARVRATNLAAREDAIAGCSRWP